VARSGGKLTPTVAELGGDIDEALEEIRVPTYAVDRSGRIRWMNARARELSGDLRGAHFTDLIAPESEQRARVEFAKQLLGTQQSTNHELILRTAAGGRVAVEAHSVALRNGERVVGIFGFADVTGPPLQPGRMPSGGLTPRQAEVLRALSRGWSTRQIAETLGISVETVRNHVRAVLRAFGVHSRLQAVADARRRGIVE
jgi:PAS domain S-box-containing protein